MNIFLTEKRINEFLKIIMKKEKSPLETQKNQIELKWERLIKID